MQYAEALVNVASQDLLREYQSINWAALEQQDPGQAALQRQKFQERQAQLRGVMHNVEQNKHQFQQRVEAQRGEVLGQEREKLTALIPEWKNAEIAQKEGPQVRAYAIKEGFPQEEVDGLVFARHVAMLRKAMLYDAQQVSKAEVEKRVRLAPKLVKPGQSTVVDPKAQSVQNLRHQIQKSGGKRGVADYLIATGKV